MGLLAETGVIAERDRHRPLQTDSPFSVCRSVPPRIFY
jgi:hypothetical protein